jgi:uncharacterized membrane protein
MLTKQILLFSTLSMFSIPVQAQQLTLSGHVKDAKTSEPLAGAVVYVREAKRNIIADDKGFYSISLPSGTYFVSATYMGYSPLVESLRVQNSLTKDFALNQQDTELEEIVVSAEQRANVIKAEMSVEKLEIKTIKRIPALMGEVDVIKAIMLLPGVQSAAEGRRPSAYAAAAPTKTLSCSTTLQCTTPRTLWASSRCSTTTW